MDRTAMQLGFIGLGRMGHNMVERIVRDSEHEVVVFDLDRAAVDTAVALGASGVASIEDFVASMSAPRVVWVMVPSGEPTRSTIARLADVLEPGDLVVDGGNSRFSDDDLHATLLAQRGIDFVDVGTSGGVWGLEMGYCMMVGGDEHAVARIAPVLDVLAPVPDEQHGPGWAHVGATGSGHYVKMVHNGVEYGMMQAFAEGFSLLAASERGVDNAQVAHLWMRGSVVRSWLCELAAAAFDLEGNELAAIEPWVDDSGEGRWTVEEAVERRIPMPVTTAALFERFSSRGRGEYAAKVNAALRAQFGGHPVRVK